MIRIQMSMSNLTNFMRKSVPVIHHAPLKKVNKSKSTFDLNRTYREANKTQIRALKHKKSHFKNTEELYKRFRNRVVSENRKIKINYFDTYFQANKSNMKLCAQI